MPCSLNAHKVEWHLSKQEPSVPPEYPRLVAEANKGKRIIINLPSVTPHRNLHSRRAFSSRTARKKTLMEIQIELRAHAAPDEEGEGERHPQQLADFDRRSANHQQEGKKSRKPERG